MIGCVGGDSLKMKMLGVRCHVLGVKDNRGLDFHVKKRENKM